MALLYMARVSEKCVYLRNADNGHLSNLQVHPGHPLTYLLPKINLVRSPSSVGLIEKPSAPPEASSIVLLLLKDPLSRWNGPWKGKIWGWGWNQC